MSNTLPNHNIATQIAGRHRNRGAWKCGRPAALLLATKAPNFTWAQF
jgi:hypothetical protein